MMKRKFLDYTLLGLISGIAPPMAIQAKAEPVTPPSPSAAPAVHNSPSSNDNVAVIRPQSEGTIWATEDPQLGVPELAISSPSVVAFDGGRITEPVRFMVRSNYTAFIHKLEVSIYRPGDNDLVDPIAIVPVPVAAVSEGYWDGALPPDVPLQHGDQLIYVLRAYGQNDIYDETFPRMLQLVRRDEAHRHSQQILDSADGNLKNLLNTDQAMTQSMLSEVFSETELRLQNIPVYGARVRIQGRNLPAGTLYINGYSYPVDLENKFAAEFLMPIGQHTFDIDLQGEEGTRRRQITVDVTGEYFFGVAIADITLSENDINGNDALFMADERYDGYADDDILKQGRLAFYLKGKTRGKYLITAQMDTTERQLDDLFSDFGQAYPRDIFRRLDPDYYYPTYGDDSTTYRDVDTQGRFYLRADWDQNQALWGNFATGMTGTDYAQYVRSLYGAAFTWRSRNINYWGDPLTELRGFGSEAETAPGHNEFLGTGGSLYYLKNQDILPGSDKVVLEIRDVTTGRVENRVNLTRGVDYEVDEIQGRIILTRALAQITRQNVPTLTRDAPLDGFEQRLIVDYEWVPSEFDDDEITSGGRVKQWLNNYFAVGGTYVDENRAGEDYNLKAGDITLQAGRGTYVRMEYSSTESFSAPTYYSDNGGFNFAPLNTLQAATGNHEGDGQLIEARANLQELGATTLPWAVGGWWREMEAGFSVNRYSPLMNTTEQGAEILGDIFPNLNLFLRYSEIKQGVDSFEQGQGTLRWGIDDFNAVSAELRHVNEESLLSDGESNLAALQYTRRIGSTLEVYGLGQVSFDESEDYAENNLVGIGGRYLLGNSSSIGAEVTNGDRGTGATVDADYRVNANYTIYAGYAYSTDTTELPMTFDPRRNSGWTFGHRWRLSNQVNLFNESTYLKEPNQTGLAHTVGLDFYPSGGWNLGLSLQSGELVDIYDGEVDRRAVSLQGGRRTPTSDWQSKIEWREDTGFERRKQWLTTNRVSHKINESWRIAGRLNFSETDDEIYPEAGAQFVESNFGFAWRPWASPTWGLFGRITYLRDLATLAQWGGSEYDQKTTIFSFEGVYNLSQQWEFAGKLARREGEYRMGRGSGAWFDSATTFSAIQARYDVGLCHLTSEYRWLDVDDGGNRHGYLLGVDRDVSDHFRVGVGYNFSDFSDDLTDYDYDHKGWYLNFVGYY
ncbi:hypothetical protein [Microbulbifer celer]|uniref:Uncharacterized protein n=1 Tax=Microbulbifer celer TaxID=435905 RepID=A0ABW3UFE6_9GAMM|nr:hypothetical protein [Microbulbifer celer]UFN55808.1 hypothetical protein LPW13_09465 [Microbulbifer celer]